MSPVLRSGSKLRDARHLQDTKHWFAFGDSWTANGFKAQAGYDPTKQPLRTSAGGKTWLNEISYSETFPNLRNTVYDFAVGGATVYPETRAAGLPNVSFPDEVDRFENGFIKSTNPDKPTWDSSTTLFSVAFGINDVNVPWYSGRKVEAVLDETFQVFDEQIARLYRLGARNFLIFDVPYYDKAPLVQILYDTYRALPRLDGSINAWNDRLRPYVAGIPLRYPGASVELYSINQWLDEALESIEASGSMIANTWCGEYVPISKDYPPDVPEDFSLPTCPAPLRQYVWIDGTHPTWPIHRLLAHDVVKTIASTEHHSSFSRRSNDLAPSAPLPRHLLKSGSGRRTGAEMRRFRARALARPIVLG
ncbi:hypothetical protein Rhopal_007119-T1 [Rhodotorula paludigena]|uniref:Uncharacterized protein n=1 Tax=Rhodotorula paludigena TaxID=86838 RepID=A0AAV5GNA3_9BASI|nr:hypothetical protein Rhopal_007119-T1 [Rhodotorula paludigena]